jgi:hypothetical protein
MEKKIILTKTELECVLTNTYIDGFNYGKGFEEEQAEYRKKKKSWSSKGRDVCSYVRNKLKELLA